MPTPKTWKPGVADEPWKVAISDREAQKAETLAMQLAEILGLNLGNVPFADPLKAYADFIGQFSGEQIAKALLDYRDSALESIKRGEKNESEARNEGAS